MDADSVARELYALRPGEFIAARDARSAEARRGGDRELASVIKSMRRPTVSAWVVNLLARERGEQLERLLSLGDALRDAQARLSADELRRLGEQRRQVIGALAADAAKAAAAHGQPVGAQAVADVEQTLQAAVADAHAAEQVRSGRLTSPLSYTGFGEVETPEGGQRTQTKRAPDAADARRREQLRKAVADAERTAEAATGAAQQARKRAQDAGAQRDERAREVEDLERRLDEARTKLAAAEDAAEQAHETLTQAEAEVQDARRAVDGARAAAEDR